ncbi:ZinT/AdcA family metal-binding protein [Bifidobacterium sp. WCA-178-WT-4B]|nr:ZinT/AdcA family metal-binding protein [Bifidobacterium sp. WCA-178-WT-4B]
MAVLNGAGYDGWAEKAQLDKKRQTIVNVGGLMGVTATDEHEHSHDHAEGEEGHRSHQRRLRGQGRGRFCHRRHRATSLQRQEETLKEMDNWPTYYPVSMSKEEVATEMLAHRFAIGPGNHVQSSPHIDVYHRYAGNSHIISTTIMRTVLI